MPLREVFQLAWESLAANKLRSLLTMLGLVIGVGAVVLLVSVGNGARNYVTREFEQLGTNLLIIQPGRTDRKSFGPPIGGAKERLTLADVEALERQALNLDAVSGIVFGSATLKVEDRIVNASLLGANERLPLILNIRIRNGEFYGPELEQGRRVAVLGYTVARDLFGDENPLGKTVRIDDSEFRVLGVTAKTGQSLGFSMDEMVFVPTRAAMRLFNEDKLFGIRARARSRASVQDAASEITEILKARHNGEEDFTVTTQVSMMDTMGTILGMLTYVLTAIAMISMVVGGIGIMNIMLVSVTERTREIGIRRAVGARRKDILRQFLVEAIVLSLAGGLSGLLGSIGITYLIYWAAPNFDMRAPFWILPPAFLMSVITGILFGVWPAWKASQIETVEALRYE